MKSHRLSTFARIALIVSVAGAMTACAYNPHYYDPYPYYSPRAMYYDYWYYPAIGAYYDPRTHFYIYHEHDHWIRARALPPRIRPYLGSYVTVRSPHDRPYEEHHRHRQHYQPERYRQSDSHHRGDDVWVGSPRQRSPQRDLDVRRIESHDRDRNDKDRRREPEPGVLSVPSHYRGQDVKYPRRTPGTRTKETPRHRESPAITTPIKRVDQRHQPVIRRDKAQEQVRSGDVRRNSEIKQDHSRSGSRTPQSGQYRAPDKPGQPAKAPPQAAPDHRKSPTRTVPAKQNVKGHQREDRKQDTQNRYREGDERRGKVQNDEHATPQKRPPRQFDRYEQYR